jgi:hypothetical protein
MFLYISFFIQTTRAPHFGNLYDIEWSADWASTSTTIHEEVQHDKEKVLPEVSCVEEWKYSSTLSQLETSGSFMPRGRGPCAHYLFSGLGEKHKYLCPLQKSKRDLPIMQRVVHSLHCRAARRARSGGDVRLSLLALRSTVHEPDSYKKGPFLGNSFVNTSLSNVPTQQRKNCWKWRFLCDPRRGHIKSQLCVVSQFS